MQPMKIRYSDCFELEQSDGTAVVRFDDPTVLHSHHLCRLADDLYGLIGQHGISSLVLDMCGVRFLSSDALGMIVNLQRKARSAGGQITLTHVSERIARMFRITHLDRILTIQEQAQETDAPAGGPGCCQTQAAD
jgi:anti-anti-sigma factor